MTDLVEELRSGHHRDLNRQTKSLRAPSATDMEAADEIERLRAKVEDQDRRLKLWEPSTMTQGVSSGIIYAPPKSTRADGVS